MNKIKRAVVFVHYDRDNIIDPYVYFYLKTLKHIVSHLVFVSTAKLTDTDISKLKHTCNTVIIRDNIGYDFMSYKAGLQSFAYQTYDEVLLCNDSVYGPLYPLERLFETMQSIPCDFWGITDNAVMGYHIQSYFMLFKHSILKSSVFKSFWDAVEVLNHKKDIIKYYEVGLTQKLMQSGYIPQVSTYFKPTRFHNLNVFVHKLRPKKILNKCIALLLCKDKVSDIGKTNATHYFWKELLIKGEIPFIKIELLRDNPMEIEIGNIDNIINEVSDYHTTYITKHLTRMKEHRC